VPRVPGVPWVQRAVGRQMAATSDTNARNPSFHRKPANRRNCIADGQTGVRRATDSEPHPAPGSVGALSGVDAKQVLAAAQSVDRDGDAVIGRATRGELGGRERVGVLRDDSAADVMYLRQQFCRVGRIR
jgi:hypothetical protein